MFQTYLRSGLRKQELENLEWCDINFAAGNIQVRAKRGWKRFRFLSSSPRAAFAPPALVDNPEIWPLPDTSAIVPG